MSGEGGEAVVAAEVGVDPAESVAAAVNDIDKGVGGDPSEVKPWHFAEGVEGSGDVPDWFKVDKYGTVADQAKAYKDLEGKFGAFTGSPEKFDVNLSQNVQDLGFELDADNPLIEQAMEFAKNSNMNQEGFDGMMELYAMSQIAEQDALNTHKQTEIAALGDNGQARIDNLVKWGSANLTPDMLDGFKEMAVSAEAVKTMEQIVSMTRNAPINPNEVIPDNAGPTAEEVKAMQFELDQYGNRRLQTDPEFKKKFDKLKSQVWGSEDARTVIG